MECIYWIIIAVVAFAVRLKLFKHIYNTVFSYTVLSTFYILEDCVFRVWLNAFGDYGSTEYQNIGNDPVPSRITTFAPINLVWVIALSALVMSKVLPTYLFYRIWKANAYDIRQWHMTGVVINYLCVFMFLNIRIYDFGCIIRHGPISMWSSSLYDVYKAVVLGQ